MVTRDDHDGVVQLPCFSQGIQGPGDHFVEMLDLDVVVEDVAADNGMIGKDLWDDHLGRILARALSRTKFECAVRFARPQPKAKRLILLHFSEKIIEVGRVIGISHRPERRFQPTFLEFLARGVGIAPSRCQASGAPSFTGKANGISRFGQYLGVGNEFLGQGTVDVARFLQAPNVLSREDGTAGRTASRGIAKGMGKTNAFPRHAIESRGLDDRIPIGPVWA